MKFELMDSTPELADIFVEWRHEPEALRLNPITSFTAAKAREHLEKCAFPLAELKEGAHWRGFIRSEGEWIGQVSIRDFNPRMGTAEIGYQIASRFQGKGWATAAARRLIDRSFSETPIRRLLATVHAENLPSCRVLEKLGFTLEGRLREHFIVDGQPADEFVYGLLRREWKG